jgi:hypothetical protein
MSASKNKIALVALILGLSTAIARAGSPPKLNVEPTCNATADYETFVGRTKKACLDEEHAAQSTLAENWSTYSAADKTQCTGTVNMGGPPSYVELLSCIETLQHVCGPDLAWRTAWSHYARTCYNHAQTNAAKVKKVRIRRPSDDRRVTLSRQIAHCKVRLKRRV